MLLMIAALFGVIIASNAQSSQCKIDGGDGYIHAEYMGGSTDGIVQILTEPTKEQPADGKVLCDITYINKDGEKKTATRTVYFYKSGKYITKVTIEPYEDIVDIRVHGAVCSNS